MRKKISESIWAKTFISMLALLVVCCIIIYGMVMIFLPKNYQAELESQVTSDFYDMVKMLERNGIEESSDNLIEFSMRNNASVEISDESGNDVFSVNFAGTKTRSCFPQILLLRLLPQPLYRMDRHISFLVLFLLWQLRSPIIF